MGKHIKIIGCCGVCTHMGIGQGTLECYYDDEVVKMVKNSNTCNNFIISVHIFDMSALVCTYPLANAGECVNNNKISPLCMGDDACQYLTKRVFSGGD